MGLDLSRSTADELASLCRSHQVKRLAIFGSALRDDFAPTSDIDALVEFEAGARVGLAFFRLQDELSALLGRRVDLNTPEFLGEEICERALREARTVYVAA